MVEISDDEISSILADYGFDASNSQCQAIRAYVSLLLRWNQTISLTTVTGIDEILRFHFGESLFALQHVPIENGRLADVGAGAGFPGLALKIGRPLLILTLLEPNQKKATFLREIRRELHLKDVEVLRSQFEQLSPEFGEFEHITARALGSHEAFVHFADSRLVKSGRLVLWIGEADAEAISSIHTFKWRDPILIPGSKRRFLLIGAKKQ
jgi:16S rRNA (guanine527-N7)-methyltransferase